MRDQHYRNSCEIQNEYDTVIEMIKNLNPAAKTSPIYPDETGEEFASSVVNSCISAVVYGDVGAWMSTGGCIAIRAQKELLSNGSFGERYKVRLAYNGPFKIPVADGANKYTMEEQEKIAAFIAQ